MKELTVAEKAYLAGIVDGEGTIVITLIKKEKHSNQYQVQVGICNTDIRLMNWVKGICGGNFYIHKEIKPEHKNRYQWKLSSNKAVKFLQEVYPYLRLKKKQAENAVELQELLGEGQSLSATGGVFGQYRSEERTKKYHQLYLSNKELNQKGRPPATTKRENGVIAEAIV